MSDRIFSARSRVNCRNCTQVLWAERILPAQRGVVPPEPVLAFDVQEVLRGSEEQRRRRSLVRRAGEQAGDVVVLGDLEREPGVQGRDVGAVLGEASKAQLRLEQVDGHGIDTNTDTEAEADEPAAGTLLIVSTL